MSDSPIFEASASAEVADRRFLATIASCLPWEKWATEIAYERYQVVRMVVMMDRLGGGGDEAILRELDLSEQDLIQIRKTVVYRDVKAELGRILSQMGEAVDVGAAIQGEAPRLVRDMIVSSRLSPDEEVRNRAAASLLDREYPKKGREPKAAPQKVLILPERVIAALSGGTPATIEVVAEEDA